MLVYVINFLSYYVNMAFRLTFCCIRMKVPITIVIVCNNNNNDHNRHKWLSFIFQEDICTEIWCF